MKLYTVYLDVAITLRADDPEAAEDKARETAEESGFDIVEGNTEVEEWGE